MWRPPRGLDALKWVSMACAIVFTAKAEHDLAMAIPGMDPFVAAAVPGALDAYVVRALQRNREVLVAVAAMISVNAASHLEAADLIDMNWKLITAVSAIAPLVLWRVHSLRDPGTWRERKLWGVDTGTDTVTGVPALDYADQTDTSTGTGTDTSTGTPADTVTCDWCGWTQCPAAHLEHHKEHACTERFRHTDTAPSTVPDTAPSTVPDTLTEADTDFLAEHAERTRSLFKDWPVPAAAPRNGVSVRVPASVPMVAYHPGTDRVEPYEHTPSTDTDTSTPVLTAVPPLPEQYPGTPTDTGTDTAPDTSTRNREHVSAGRILASDTAHMDTARDVFTKHGGGDGIVRAMKSGIGSGTARAQRLTAACKHEHAEGWL